MNATSGIPLPLTPALTRERDGCDCPECVIRCVHIEGLAALVLTFATATQQLHLKCNPAPMIPYSLGYLAEWHNCSGCGAPRGFSATGYPRALAFDCEADALAAFYAAELELLARDEA